MKKTLKVSTMFLVLVALAGLAYADVTQKVQQEFAGKVIITKGALPEAGATDADTIKAFKKAHLKSIKAESQTDEGSAEWSFEYTAFFKKALPVTEVSIDFYTTDKEKNLVANKRLIGLEPGLPVLAGTLNISEDDGPAKGKTYTVKVTGKVKGKEQVFAETTLELK